MPADLEKTVVECLVQASTKNPCITCGTPAGSKKCYTCIKVTEHKNLKKIYGADNILELLVETDRDIEKDFAKPRTCSQCDCILIFPPDDEGRCGSCHKRADIFRELRNPSESEIKHRVETECPVCSGQGCQNCHETGAVECEVDAATFYRKEAI